jgi:hypothetical protein
MHNALLALGRCLVLRSEVRSLRPQGSFDLPSLHKKIIYFDQFEMIGMLLALHPDAKKIPETEVQRWGALLRGSLRDRRA